LPALYVASYKIREPHQEGWGAYRAACHAGPFCGPSWPLWRPADAAPTRRTCTPQLHT